MIPVRGKNSEWHATWVSNVDAYRRSAFHLILVRIGIVKIRPTIQLKIRRLSRWLAIISVALLFSGCSLLGWSDHPSSPHRQRSGGSGTAQSSSRKPPASTSGADAQTATKAAPRLPDYVVKPGDTLYSIAFRNQIDYHDIANWNDIGRDYRISVGQKLHLSPPDDGLVLIGAAPASAPRNATAISKDGSNNSPANNSTAVAGGANSRSSSMPDLPPARPLDEGPISAWRWPTDGQVVHRYAPDDGQKGIDIAGQPGQPIVASAAGKVVYSGSALKGYGELVIIKHNERYLSAYGYNRRRLVEEGQQVSAGQAIAEMGEGPAQQAMVHFEIRDKGTPINPLPQLPGR